MYIKVYIYMDIYFIFFFYRSVNIKENVNIFISCFKWTKVSIGIRLINCEIL